MVLGVMAILVATLGVISMTSLPVISSWPGSTGKVVKEYIGRRNYRT